MESLRPTDLDARLKNGDSLILLDVRQPGELEICVLPGVVHIPLGDLGVRHSELDPDAEIVCICHHGVRSAHACLMLESFGFENAINMTGGMELWATEMDPAMARY
ncbi:MAG: rhodanese-like domain-containing protein [Planctomycetota bacterium]|nr:rhodanese-like domain-containing protein [Planctomycetota bacterium]